MALAPLVTNNVPLTDEQRRRYARHLVLADIGEAGQQTLLDSHVTILGCGGLGSPAAGYLAAMGIGKLTLIDDDRVELSNLQRQILFETADIGEPKAAAAENRINEINSDTYVRTCFEKLTEANAAELIADADVVIDGSDNFTTRIALHDACARAGKPLIYAAISGFSAQLTTFKSYLGVAHPCLHCFMPETPNREVSCAQEGILGALAGTIGSMQALEAVKELLSIGESLSGRILRYDGLSGTWKTSLLSRQPSCHFCNK